MVNEKIINTNFNESNFAIKDNNLNNTLNYNDLTKKFTPDNQGNNSLVKNRIYPPIGTIRNKIGGKKNKSRKRRQRKRNSTKKV